MFCTRRILVTTSAGRAACRNASSEVSRMPVTSARNWLRKIRSAKPMAHCFSFSARAQRNLRLTQHPVTMVQRQVDVNRQGGAGVIQQGVERAEISLQQRLIDRQGVVFRGLEPRDRQRHRVGHLGWLSGALFEGGSAFPGARRCGHQQDHGFLPAAVCPVQFATGAGGGADQSNSSGPELFSRNARRICAHRQEPQGAEPYSFSLRYSVVLPMPRRRAASSLSPCSASIARRMACFSNSATGVMVSASETGIGGLACARKLRSEERRVGEEGRIRWSPYH